MSEPLLRAGSTTRFGLAGVKAKQMAQAMSSEIVGTAPYRFQKLIGREIIQEHVQQVAARLREDYRDKQPVLVGVLNGCFIYMADVIRAMNIPCEVDFIKVSSYRD